MLSSQGLELSSCTLFERSKAPLMAMYATINETMLRNRSPDMQSKTHLA
jgi:hypothetical protein